MDLATRPGDLLLFRGANWRSRAIALGTNWPSQWAGGCAPSHVAVVADYKGCRRLFESTTLCDLPCLIQSRKIKGVQCHSVTERVEKYAGKVWQMRPAEPLSGWQRQKLADWCRDQVGSTYDFDSLLVTGTILRRLTFIRPRPHATICSRYVMQALRAASIVNGEWAPSEWTPAKIARRLPHDELYSWPVRLK